MARAVATFPIPVISGIGHSTNETVVEMVAHLNRITPTAVADTLVDIYRNLDNKLQNMKAYVSSIGDHKIKPEKQKLLNAIHYLKSYAAHPITQEKMRIQRWGTLVKNSSEKRILGEHNKINLTLKSKLTQGSNNVLSRATNKLGLLETKLNILDPKKLLKRGYSMTVKDGKTVTDLEQLKEGDEITTRFHTGSVEAKIIKINRDE